VTGLADGVRLGEVRATRPERPTCAAIPVNNHEANRGAQRDLATSKGIAVPSGLAAGDRKPLDRLARTCGTAVLREAQRINNDDMRALMNVSRHWRRALQP